MQGILIVDKPAGWTSFDVIAKLRGALHTKKIGHSGTLDPMATGVLPLFCGGASKAVDLQQNHDKTYLATLRLGYTTDTGDITGQVLEQAPVTAGAMELMAALPQFCGTLQQMPPMYSAVKVNGMPLYKAARRGLNVERKPRTITVYDIAYLGSPGENEHSFSIRCSKGTYVRTLLEELALAAGQKGTMSALRRTAAGVYTQKDAHSLEEILAACAAGTVEQLFLPLDSAFVQLSALKVNERVRLHLLNGCPTSHFHQPDGRYRVYDEQGQFLGLARVVNQVLQVEKLFIERS